jgi:hypothetical protein
MLRIEDFCARALWNYVRSPPPRGEARLRANRNPFIFELSISMNCILSWLLVRTNHLARAPRPWSKATKTNGPAVGTGSDLTSCSPLATVSMAWAIM